MRVTSDSLNDVYERQGYPPLAPSYRSIAGYNPEVMQVGNFSYLASRASRGSSRLQRTVLLSAQNDKHSTTDDFYSLIIKQNV